MAEDTTRARGGEVPTLTKRWGDVALARGFTALPTSLLALQAHLKLDPTVMNLVMQLLRFWRDDLPFPSQTTLARLMGINPRTVRRRVQAMQKNGHLEITHGISTTGRPITRYDLRPLIRALTIAVYGAGMDEPVKRQINTASPLPAGEQS
jgi:hypothetical protein